LRIGLLCHSSVGGSVRVTVDLARGLAAAGHDVHVLSRSVPFGLDDATDVVSCHALVTGRQHDPHLRLTWPVAERRSFVDMVVDVSRRFELDILHFHYAIPFAELTDAARRKMGGAAPAVIGTLHGTDVGRRPENGLAAALERVDAVTTVSMSQAELAMCELGLSEQPRVIANTVDPRRFFARGFGRRRANDPLRVLHVSNFRAVKDPVRLARAFTELRQLRRATLWLVGDGEQMDAVRSALKSGGVIDDVRFFGLRTDMELLYPQADIVALTSRWESFSLVALEAASCGVPVVAPSIGGLPEVVAHGRTGLLYDLADETEPARTLLRLSDDEPGRERMSVAAVRHAQAFRHELGIARYEALYREILERRGAHRWTRDVMVA
jgi:N-acetyl-alpha-D-glucosaminyl L-malate synthase BshA